MPARVRPAAAPSWALERLEEVIAYLEPCVTGNPLSPDQGTAVMSAGTKPA